MINKIKNLISQNLINNTLIRGSFVVFIGSIIVGFGNYLFQLIMGRMLSPAQFGALASLLSITIIVSVPNQTIALLVTKYVADLESKGAKYRVKPFLNSIIKKLIFYGITAAIIFFALIPFFKSFLHIQETLPLIMLGLFLTISFFSPIGLGVLRGLQRFLQYSTYQIYQVIVKIILGVTLVAFGFGINGALLAQILGVVFFIIFVFAKLNLPKANTAEENKNSNHIFKFSSYTAYTFIASLFLVVLYNLDVILAKHFLPPTEAGYYAILSLLGKIILFATASISSVMFPIVANNHGAGRSNRKIFFWSFIIISFISIIIAFCYIIFPGLIVKLLFGNAYLSVVPNMWLISIIYLCFSLINFISLFLLSIQRLRFVYILASGTLIEIAMIYFRHAHVQEILYSMLICMIAMLIGFFIYLFLNFKEKIIIYENNLNNNTNL